MDRKIKLEEERIQIVLDDFVKLEIVGFVTSPVETIVEMHSHPFWEMIYTYKGQGMHICGGREIASPEGSMLLIPPGEIHKFINDERYETEKMYIGFSVSDALAKGYLGGMNYILSDLPASEMIKSELNEVIKFIKQDIGDLITLKRIVLVELMTKIVKHMMSISESRDNSTDYRQGILVEKIKGYLRKNINRSVSLAEFATILYISPHYAGDVFKSVTGMTLKEYHNTLRMERALRMIKETQLNITEISGQLGFESIHYFSRKFKEYYKVPPSSFRETI